MSGNMGLIAEWFRRISYLLNRRRHQDVLRVEMESHRAMMADPRSFGNTLRWREESQDVWGWTWLDDVGRDLRFAARTLRRSPGVAVVAVLSLALATGATTAIFSVVNSVLLRPLPFFEPDRLVQIYGRSWSEDRGGPPDPIENGVRSPELEAYTTASTSFEGFTNYDLRTKHLDGPSGVERLISVDVGPGAFALLGVDPILGRTFVQTDSADVVVFSERLWRRGFNADPTIVGRSVILDGRGTTVVGVMPDRFEFPAGALAESRADLWTVMAPVRMPNGSLRQGAASTVARLKRGVTVAAAVAELRVIAARVEQQYRDRGSQVRVGVRVVPLADAVLAKVRRSLWMLFAAVGLVLAAACANVANLLLARMSARTREVVTRAALGASARRLVRQFLVESLLLSFAGGALGVVVARVGTDLLVRIASARLPRSHEIVLDWQAFVFLFVLCLANAILFGLAPALAAARVSVEEITREGGGRSTVGGSLGRLRDALVAIEVALAFVLALGAAVVIREVIRLQKVETGMVTANVVTLHITPKTTERDYYAIESSVAALPGVAAAGFTQLVPLQKSGWEADFSVKGRAADPTDRRIAGLRYVTPGYFRTLGIPLVRGRSFTANDTAESPRVIMVNDALVQRYFPGEDIVGWEFNRGTVIGVVGSVRQAALDRPSEPELYYPVAQNYTMYTELGMSLLVRTAGRPQSSIDAIRSAVNGVNPRLAIFNVKTMEQVVVDSLWELNLYVWLIGLFAALTLLLTAIGLYGVISYNVTSRIREFAVRLALGSEPAAVTRLVLGRAMRLTAAGLAGGIFVALSLALAFRNLPIRIGTDPVSYVTVSVALLAVALAACMVPATRVARVNPATALRHD